MNFSFVNLDNSIPGNTNEESSIVSSEKHIFYIFGLLTLQDLLHYSVTRKQIIYFALF